MSKPKITVPSDYSPPQGFVVQQEDDGKFWIFRENLETGAVQRLGNMKVGELLRVHRSKAAKALKQRKNSDEPFQEVSLEETSAILSDSDVQKLQEAQSRLSKQATNTKESIASMQQDFSQCSPLDGLTPPPVLRQSFDCAAQMYPGACSAIDTYLASLWEALDPCINALMQVSQESVTTDQMNSILIAFQKCSELLQAIDSALPRTLVFISESLKSLSYEENPQRLIDALSAISGKVSALRKQCSQEDQQIHGTGFRDATSSLTNVLAGIQRSFPDIRAIQHQMKTPAMKNDIQSIVVQATSTGPSEEDKLGNIVAILAYLLYWLAKMSKNAELINSVASSMSDVTQSCGEGVENPDNDKAEKLNIENFLKDNITMVKGILIKFDKFFPSKKGGDKKKQKAKAMQRQRIAALRKLEHCLNAFVKTLVSEPDVDRVELNQLLQEYNTACNQIGQGYKDGYISHINLIQETTEEGRDQ